MFRKEFFGTRAYLQPAKSQKQQKSLIRHQKSWLSKSGERDRHRLPALPEFDCRLFKRAVCVPERFPVLCHGRYTASADSCSPIVCPTPSPPPYSADSYTSKCDVIPVTAFRL